MLANKSMQAQESAFIKGILPGAEGKTIHLMMTSDYLVEDETSTQKKVIDNDGSFSFEVNITSICPITLSVNFHNITFFIVPGEQYVLNGKKIIFDNNINPYIVRPPLPLMFSDPDPLNRFLMQFDQKKQQFETERYKEIFNSQNLSEFDVLWIPVDTLPEKYRKFCKDYQTYSIGALKANYSKKRSLKLGTNYLNNEKPDISNYCYMLFFNAFFDDYLPYHSNEIAFAVLQEAINKGSPLSNISDILKKDPIFSDNELQTLFLIKLMEQYPFRESSITKLLNEITKSKQSEQIVKAAKDALRQNNRLLSGMTAPDFTLSTQSENTLKSSTLKGKFLYVNFFKTNCYDCLAEMEIMKELYAKNKRFFEFISICIDNEESNFQTFSKTGEYPWTILYVSYNQDFILQWQAKTIPYYVLIDKEHKIISCPALSPKENISHILNKISWEEQRKQREKN